MAGYLLRRSLSVIPIVFGVTIVTFFLFNVLSQDPVIVKMGKYGSQAEMDTLRHEMGLDRPLFQQYLFYLKQCITFDFGRSWTTNQKISQMFLDGIGPSLSLSLPAFSFSILLSLLIAIFLAAYRDRVVDKVVMVTCLAVMSVSVLIYIIFFQYFFAFKLGWFPISGFEMSWLTRWKYIALPAIIWIFTSLGAEILLYRTAIFDEYYSDYVRTARAKGLNEFYILRTHVLKNSLIPIVTVIVSQIPFLYTGSLLLEAFFQIPGLGGMTVQALYNSDFPVIKAMTFWGSLVYIFCNFISDFAYTILDPRIKLQ